MRLQRHLLAELLTAFVLVSMIVTSIVFAALLLKFLHKYPALSMLSVLRAAPYLVPMAFPITLPLSFLIACLLTYGRFADDNEFLASQMGGIHPWHVASPAVAASCVLAVATVLVNLDVIPFATLTNKEIARGEIRQILRAVDDPTTDRVSMGGFQMSWNGRDERGLKDVLLTMTAPRREDDDGGDRERQVIHASRGRMDGSRLDDGLLVLDLDDVDTQFGEGAARTTWHEENRVFAVDIETIAGVPPARESKAKDEMNASQLHYKAERMRLLAGDDPHAKGERELMWAYETEYWSRIAMGLSPMAFALVGVGLGLGGGRGSRMAAFLVAILVALPVYHPLLLLGRNLARSGVLPAVLSVNLGNLLLGGLGLWRIGRAAR